MIFSLDKSAVFGIRLFLLLPGVFPYIQLKNMKAKACGVSNSSSLSYIIPDLCQESQENVNLNDKCYIGFVLKRPRVADLKSQDRSGKGASRVRHGDTARGRQLQSAGPDEYQCLSYPGVSYIPKLSQLSDYLSFILLYFILFQFINPSRWHKFESLQIGFLRIMIQDSGLRVGSGSFRMHGLSKIESH